MQKTSIALKKTKQDMQKEHEKQLLSGESVSGVVVASKIANAISKGYIDSAFDENFDATHYKQNMDELSKTVQLAERVRDDVSILTVPPVQKLIPGKMIVINLPGNGTSMSDNDRNPFLEMRVKVAAEKGVAEFFDFIDTDKLKPSDCQVVGCYYSHKVNEMIEQYNAHGVLHPGIVEFSNIFDDLISKDGKKTDVDTVVKNMQNVVLRGQCFGTLVVAELEKCLYHKLAALGYQKDECHKILSAPTALLSSSPVAMDRQPQFFKTVAYANAADTLIPTIKGSPNYQKEAGFSDDEIASENRQFKTIQKAPNYQLIVCSSLEFPSDAELKEYVENTYHTSDEAKIKAHMDTIHKGHAFNAIANVIKKDSDFMQTLRLNVKKMMTRSVQTMVENYCLGKIGYTPRYICSPKYRRVQNNQITQNFSRS